jgi:taurine dioxygenase
MQTVRPGPRRVQRLGDGLDPEPYTRFGLKPLSPLIGAEIEGVDLAEKIGEPLLADLRRALLEWKVLFFRNQAHISGQQHRDFARLWGELEVHPFLPAGDVPEVVRFEKGQKEKGVENIWHSDVSWREVPALGSVLRAIAVPDLGGDTMWADMGAAYDGLPRAIKDRIDGLEAVHDFTQSFGIGMDADRLAEMQREYPAVRHPVVRTHPETGRKTLYVNEIFTREIVGESHELLAYLCQQARVPEYQCRFRWTPGAVAFWDNRATQHYAISDYWPSRRVMERATIIGDRPR